MDSRFRGNDGEEGNHGRDGDDWMGGQTDTTFRAARRGEIPPTPLLRKGGFLYCGKPLPKSPTTAPQFLIANCQLITAPPLR